MGNSISPCFQQQQQKKGSSSSAAEAQVKLVYFDGTTRFLSARNCKKDADDNDDILAGEIMLENPDHQMVFHADSFFIGHPFPLLSIEDQLIPGQTYFIVPTNRFSFNHNNVVSASSLSALACSHYKRARMINFGHHECPFQYIKGDHGRVLIKVVPEFITRLLTEEEEDDVCSSSSAVSHLCTTAELKKHYDQLVGCRNQTWSPKLETISECNRNRYSPRRFLGFECKHKQS